MGLGREMFVFHIRIMGTPFDDSPTCVDLGRFMGRLWSAFPTCGPSWSVVSSTNVKPESSLQRDCSLSGRKSCEGRASGESCLPTCVSSACSDAIPESIRLVRRPGLICDASLATKNSRVISSRPAR